MSIKAISINGGGLTESLIKNRLMIENIVDGMFDLVRVLDKDDNVIYMNKAMSEYFSNPGIGSKCYELLGRTAPCENCISRKSVFEGASQEKEEVINGRSFYVMSSPIRNNEGQVIAAVEVLRDNTYIKQLYQKTHKQNEKLKNELEMARKLQSSLLPGPFSDKRLAFSYLYMPCDNLGGDFIDIFNIDNSHIGLYIADVSGHGVPASLLTVFLRSSLNKKLLSPAKALEELFYEFNQNNFDVELYITIFYTIIDLRNRTLLYSNAGLNVSPVIYSNKRFDFLRLPGIPISNWADKVNYHEGTAELEQCDKLFIYTDGILEARNPENEQYGEDRLINIMLSSGSNPKQLLLGIKKSVFSFAGLKASSDLKVDITMDLLEIR